MRLDRRPAARNVAATLSLLVPLGAPGLLAGSALAQTVVQGVPSQAGFPTAAPAAGSALAGPGAFTLSNPVIGAASLKSGLPAIPALIPSGRPTAAPSSLSAPELSAPGAVRALSVSIGAQESRSYAARRERSTTAGQAAPGVSGAARRERSTTAGQDRKSVV